MSDGFHIFIWASIQCISPNETRLGRRDASRAKTIPRGKRKFIAIAGNIGSGKSSLLEFLTASCDVVPFYEPNDANPYLSDFYRDMRRWAFQSQLFLLASKFRIHQEADRGPGVVIQDRTIFEDAEIFATALRQMRKIDERERIEALLPVHRKHGPNRS